MAFFLLDTSGAERLEGSTEPFFPLFVVGKEGKLGGGVRRRCTHKHKSIRKSSVVFPAVILGMDTDAGI